MNKRWTLHVENFAKIKMAEIEISPLICFVGENNSGKSYVMSLIWGLLTFGKELFPQKPSDATSYKVCESWLETILYKDVEIDSNTINLFITWFNHLLAANAKLLCKKIFNYSVDIEKLEVIKYDRDNQLLLKWNENGSRYSLKGNTITFPSKEIYTREDKLKMCAYICWNILMEGIAAPLFTPIVKGRRIGEPVYLPASRTGFMLTYKQLISKTTSIFNDDSIDDIENESTTLTKPYIDFLQLITQFESPEKPLRKYEKVIEFLENNMIRGKVSTKTGFIPDFKYVPAGAKKEIPLHVSSSVVSEVSPLILLLKSNIKFNTIIIEEPEAHLHPQLQLEMAKFILRLVNLGIPVWITTHSDTILQHFNNMIKLDYHKDKVQLMNEFSYTKDDIVKLNDTKMYQFTTNKRNETIIKPLESNKHGFIVPTFNNALENLLREVYAFQQED